MNKENINPSPIFTKSKTNRIEVIKKQIKNPKIAETESEITSVRIAMLKSFKNSIEIELGTLS